jgi:hypothetical protein
MEQLAQSALSQFIVGAILGVPIAVVLGALSGYELGKGVATAAFVVLAFELFTGQLFMLAGTVLAGWTALAIGLFIKGKLTK